MFTVPEQVVSAQKDNIDSFIKFAGITAASAERLVDLNLKTAKAAFDDAIKGTKSLTDVKDVQQLASLQSEWSQPAAEKFTSYMKSTYGILSETQAELAKFFEDKVAEFNKNMVGVLDNAVKNAPAGSDVAVAALKSAIAAGNQAYDAFSKASRQAAEITEATVNAATANAPAKKKAA